MPQQALWERFWKKVNKNGPMHPHLGTPCWLWVAAKHRQGYGLFQYATRTTRRAHRVAWLLTKGDPLGKDVLHRCDIEECVNPDHLYLGTDQDNARDRVVRERSARGDRHKSRTCPTSVPSGKDHYLRRHPEKILRGEDTGASKLTEAQVLAIKQEYSPYQMSYPKLARKYGVHPETIGRVIRGEYWGHVKEGN